MCFKITEITYNIILVKRNIKIVYVVKNLNAYLNI